MEKEKIMLDKTFTAEVRKAANGDGEREYLFALIHELREISSALSNRYQFDNCMKKYGRAKVTICVACTITRNSYRFESPQIAWAQAVMKLWTNKNDRSISAATINIHPAILADNSHDLRKATLLK